MAIQIRQATRADMPTIRERTIETSWEMLSPDARARTSKEAVMRQVSRLVDRLLDNGPNTILVAVNEQGQNVGHVWLGEMKDSFSGDPKGYIYDLYVQPEQRRQGIGRELVQAAQRSAKLRGYQEIGLAVSAYNPNAKALYEAMGFAVDHFVMMRRIE